MEETSTCTRVTGTYPPPNLNVCTRSPYQPPQPSKRSFTFFHHLAPPTMTSPLPYSKAQLTEDTHVAYIDSWGTKPAAELPERYTTLIALHGVGFNSGTSRHLLHLTTRTYTKLTFSALIPQPPTAVWTPLLPHLPSSTRFLAYNQRSYTGSSPAFESKKEGGTDATAAYLGDLLNFIEFAVEELKVPAIDDATGKGGIALLVSLHAECAEYRTERENLLCFDFYRAGQKALSYPSPSSHCSTPVLSSAQHPSSPLSLPTSHSQHSPLISAQ